MQEIEVVGINEMYLSLRMGRNDKNKVFLREDS